MIGNENTGDLTALTDILDNIRYDDCNWVTAEIKNTNLTVQMKVFAVGSVFGIGNGRISKMSIYDDVKRLQIGFFNACEMNYDRGWDIKPKSKEAKARLAAIVGSLDGKMTFKKMFS